MRQTLMLPILFVSCFMVACLESNPQPSPISGAKGGDMAAGDAAMAQQAFLDKIFVSSPDDQLNVVIVGDDGAAPGAEKVEVDSDDESYSSTVNEDGSFGLLLQNWSDPTVTLTFTYGANVDHAAITIEVPSSPAESAPWVGSNIPEDMEGIKNSYDGQELANVDVAFTYPNELLITGSLLSATPYSLVFGVNLSGGDQDSVQADETGSFQIKLEAKPGDSISLFVVNPEDKSSASPPIFLEAPPQ